jgi:hypothetical protein
MATALAVRDASARQAEKGRPIETLDLDAIVAGAVRAEGACIACPDDVFEGIARAIHAQSHCTLIEAFEQVPRVVDPSRSFGYTRWRHGGWYVGGVRYPSGACGCLGSDYPDKRWRIVCDDRRQASHEPGDVTLRSRDEAARAEQVLALQAWTALIRSQA